MGQVIETISPELIKEALDYSLQSKSYTSNRHDFHEGGLDAKQRKMFEGKLGEKIFKTILLRNDIDFNEDNTSHTDADIYDFIMPNKVTIDVKTRTQNFHTRTLEMVEQFIKNPKDIYVSVRLFAEKKEGFVVGWCTKEDIKKINRIENNGYLDNYVLFDNELRPINELITDFNQKGFKHGI
jgi:hypothetical protein